MYVFIHYARICITYSYVFMYVVMHLLICIHVYIHMHIWCRYTCKWIHVLMRVSIQLCNVTIHSIYVYIHVLLYLCIIYMAIHVCMYAYMSIILYKYVFLHESLFSLHAWCSPKEILGTTFRNKKKEYLLII